MFVSAITCTRNGVASLRRILDSATALTIPKDLAWEFIVVDNGRTDDTAAVVASFADRLPVHCVLETVPGLSNARNRDVDESRGDLIVWTYDDFMVDPRWLVAYVDAAARFPAAGFVGGNIAPILQEPVACLFARNFDSSVLGHLMARRRFSKPSAEIRIDSMTYYTSSAVRGAIQRRHRFNPRLGVSPLHKRSTLETNLLYEAVADGASCRTVPASNERPFLPAPRQRKPYMRKPFAAVGKTCAFVRT